MRDAPMTNWIPAGLLGLMVLLAGGGRAAAQGCCAASGAGSVTGTASQGVTGHRQFDVAVFLERFDLNETVSERGTLVLVDGNRARTTTLNLAISYGWTERLTTTAMVGYFSRGRNFAVPGLGGGEAGAVNADGIGDVTFFAKYALRPYRPDQPHEIALGVGLKLPVGDDSQSRRGLILPVDVQPGSGATDWLFWARVFRQTPVADLAGNVTWTVTGASGNERLGLYQFGNALSYEVTVTRSVATGLELGLDVVGRVAASDRSLSLEVINTGGHRLYAGPTVSWSPVGRSLTLHGSVLLPVSENINGLQQGLTQAWRIGTAVRFGGM